jgi:phage shock protein C
MVMIVFSANSLSSKYHFLYMKRLYRSKKEQMLGGICGGFAEYIDVDPSIIRLVLVVLIVLSWGLFILVYIAAWIIIPASPEESTLQTIRAEG